MLYWSINGIEAIATYTTHQDDIRAVLIDMMMPLMDGTAAIKVLTQINPDVKIIACSGVLSNSSFDRAVGVKAFLSKPFTTADLLNALHTGRRSFTPPPRPNQTGYSYAIVENWECQTEYQKEQLNKKIGLLFL
jgi:CheY-like chemotaxis protein